MKNEYDIIVVGAGPAGSIAARFAAEQGVSVLMLEKDRDVGYPVRCGEAANKKGIVEFIEPNEKWITARINKVSLNSPDGNAVVIPYEENYILERRIFDYELARIASEKGAEILTRAYVNGLLFDNGKVAGVKYEYNGEQKEVRSKIVIAADGVESRVGRWAGMETHCDFREMGCCVQVTASNIRVNADTIYLYFGKEFAPEGYFWIFPKGEDMANIGLGVSGLIGKKKSASVFLSSFMEKRYPNASILSRVAGGVPTAATLKKISAPGIMLVGDAAHQVNPVKGAGITTGMYAGSIVGRIAGEAVRENKLEKIFLYDKEWHDRFGKKHEIYNRVKNSIRIFPDQRFNTLADSFNKIPYEKRSLGKLITSALINEPSLLIDVAKVFVI